MTDESPMPPDDGTPSNAPPNDGLVNGGLPNDGLPNDVPAYEPAAYEPAAGESTAEDPTVPTPQTPLPPRNPWGTGGVEDTGSWPTSPAWPAQAPPPVSAPATPAWQTPPSWGSAPQGWPPAPPAPTPFPTPPSTATPTSPPVPVSPPFGQFGGPPAASTTPPSPPYGAGPPPASGSVPPGMGAPLSPPPPGSGGGSWNYGYGPTAWGPPPGSSPPSNAARRTVVAIAVVLLVFASAGVGAAISAAVHSNNDNNTAFTPNSGNGNGNGFGLGNGLGDPFGNNSGGNSGNGSGNGSGTGSNQAPASIVSKVNPAVVDIYTTIQTGNSQGEAAGTGMVITSSGEVLTNNHVIDGASTVRVQIVGTGQTHTAKVLGYDVVDDVALLQIDNVSNLKTVSFADAASAGIGDSVVAIGNAGGRGGTPAATSGSITALDQKVTAGDQGTGNSETLHGMIQISAPIEPGDSGGPLVDTDGKVIGMNTAAAQSDDFFGQSGTSTAFAIPIEKAVGVAKQIEAGRDSNTVHVGERGILGVQVRNVNQNGVVSPVSSGAALAGVEPSGPADSAGMGEGDVITAIDGKSVTNASDLTSMMFTYHPDDRVDVGWVDQSGSQHHDTLKLVAGPPS